MSNLADPKAVNNWFIVHDLNHLRAWKQLQETGFWPKGFIPSRVTFPANWQMVICARLADEYVRRELAADYARSIP